MPANIVRAHYDELNKIAGAFGAQAVLLRQSLQALRASQDTLQGGDWAGQGATAFYKEMDDSVLPTLQRLINALDTAQTSITQISSIMKNAEDQAANVLKGQGGGGGGGSSIISAIMKAAEGQAARVLERPRGLEQIILQHEGARRVK